MTRAILGLHLRHKASADPSQKSPMACGQIRRDFWRRRQDPSSCPGQHYRMPAEWEPHEATWLAWPTNRQTFPGELLKEVEEIYFRMIYELLMGEKVHLLVPDQRTPKGILRRLGKHRFASRLYFHQIRATDVWIRDYGPIYVERISPRKIMFTKWIFNAWGRKYPGHLRDNGVVQKIRALKKNERISIPYVLEGGSIDVNGSGLALTTEQCLLNSNRNPGLDKKAIGGLLRQVLGVDRMIWLKGGIKGDDTDGHIDDVARFVKKDLILVACEKDKRDSNYAVLSENLQRLREAKESLGGRLKVETLPMPEPIYHRRYPSVRLPASYANFYIANASVLVPVFSDSHDRQVLSQIKSLFKGRKVLGIDCRALVHGLGAFHCITQQKPL
jgi:agmatine deiminase